MSKSMTPEQVALKAWADRSGSNRNPDGKVKPLSPEEYERRKRIEEERDARLMMECKLSIRRGEVPTTSMAGTIPRGGAARW